MAGTGCAKAHLLGAKERRDSYPYIPVNSRCFGQPKLACYIPLTLYALFSSRYLVFSYPLVSGRILAQDVHLPSLSASALPLVSLFSSLAPTSLLYRAVVIVAGGLLRYFHSFYMPLVLLVSPHLLI